jgi:hypothetical protein
MVASGEIGAEAHRFLQESEIVGRNDDDMVDALLFV